MPARYSFVSRWPVPAPAERTWEEVERGEIAPQSVTMRSMPGRLTKLGDLWAELLPVPRSPRKQIAR